MIEDADISVLPRYDDSYFRDLVADKSSGNWIRGLERVTASTTSHDIRYTRDILSLN